MAHANVVETAGMSINVDQWLQNAKLSELKPKFAADSITIEELMELSPEDLLEFANDELQLKSLKRNRFIKAIRKSIASSSIAMQPGAIATAVTGETMGLDHDDADIDDEDSEDNDDDDEKKAEMKEQEEAVLKGQQILKSVLNRIEVNLQKINVFLDEGIQSESKKRLDAIHQVFELFATKLMDRKSKLIDEFNAEIEKQVVAIKAFQSEMNAFKQSIAGIKSLKDKPAIIAKQKDLMESSDYRKIKSFALPVIKLAVEKDNVLGQIREIGNIETRSMLTGNAGNNQMLNSSMPSSVKNMITIQIGGCGNKMGNLFWGTLKTEYGMDDELRTDAMTPEDVDTYFREISENRYIPRGIACDTNYSKVSPLLNRSNICQSQGDSVERSVCSLYTAAPKLFEQRIKDCVRKEVEVCDAFRGFQFHYNIGGGAGSGLTAYLEENFSADYKTKIQLHFTCFPGKQYSVPFEPYNIALGLRRMIHNFRIAAGHGVQDTFEHVMFQYNQNRILPIYERADGRGNANAMIVLDNEMTHKLCTKLKGKAQSKMDFDAVNRVHNLMINDISSILMLPTSTGVVMKSGIVSEESIRKIKNGAQRLANIWNPSYCPLFLTSYQQEIDNRLNAKALTTRIMNQKNESTDVVNRYQLIYRGKLDLDQIKQALDGQFKNDDQFKVYNVRTSSCFTRTSAVKLDNGNGWIKDRLKGIVLDVQGLWKRKEFFQQFRREGIDPTEMDEALYEIQPFIDWFQSDAALESSDEVDELEFSDDSSDEEEDEEDL